jgi:hypothetical protein
MASTILGRTAGGGLPAPSGQSFFKKINTVGVRAAKLANELRSRGRVF